MTTPPRFTVMVWFQLVLALMILLAIVSTAVGGTVINRTDQATDQLQDRTLPATTEAYQLQSALISQETGLRGYAITADPQFLEPYNDGRREQADATATLRVLLVGQPSLLADVDTIDRQAELWHHDYAEPLIATNDPAAARQLALTTADRGKAIFDQLRADFLTQHQHLAQTKSTDAARVQHARTVRNVVLFILIAAFVLTAIVSTVLVRRLIARPLEYLTAASRQVADGDFEHRIDASGPADLTMMATAVEDMRRRIVAELASSHEQRAVLLQQKTFLDSQTVELRRSNAELEQFAYVASHDLQEPLRKVASFCQLLDKRYGNQLDERGTQYLHYAVDGSIRMQALINDLLTFSRVGRLTGEAAPVPLAQSLDKALANLSGQIEDTDARVEIPDQLPELTGEPVLLTMLWQNLIANAIKFRGADGVPQVQVTCEPGSENEGWRFTVSDNGIGIPPEFAEKVFVIFQRLHGRTEYEGTGIGLAICKKIVEHHGGHIWIDPDYSPGTRFCFTLRGVEDSPEVPEPEGSIS